MSNRKGDKAAPHISSKEMDSDTRRVVEEAEAVFARQQEYWDDAVSEVCGVKPRDPKPE